MSPRHNEVVNALLAALLAKGHPAKWVRHPEAIRFGDGTGLGLWVGESGGAIKVRVSGRYRASRPSAKTFREPKGGIDYGKVADTALAFAADARRLAASDKAEGANDRVADGLTLALGLPEDSPVTLEGSPKGIRLRIDVTLTEEQAKAAVEALRGIVFVSVPSGRRRKAP